MVPFQEILLTLGSIAGIVVLAGSVLIYVKGTYSKSVIEALRADLSEERLDATKLQGKLDAQGAKLQAEITKNEVLTNLVTQKAQVEEVMALLNEHHQESLAAWAAITAELKRMHS